MLTLEGRRIKPRSPRSSRARRSAATTASTSAIPSSRWTTRRERRSAERFGLPELARLTDEFDAREPRSLTTCSTNTKAFSGFAVDDVDKAREFYGDTLGLETVLDEENGLLTLHIAGDRDTLVYPEARPHAGDYTILNFPVDDIDAAVDELTARGVEFERYEALRAGRQGHRARPRPAIAWFKDPAGNMLSVLQAAVAAA